MKLLPTLFLLLALTNASSDLAEEVVLRPFLPEIKYSLYLLAPPATNPTKRIAYFTAFHNFEKIYSNDMENAIRQVNLKRRSPFHIVSPPTYSFYFEAICEHLSSPESREHCYKLLTAQARLSFPAYYIYIRMPPVVSIPSYDFEEDFAILGISMQTMEIINTIRMYANKDLKMYAATILFFLQRMDTVVNLSIHELPALRNFYAERRDYTLKMAEAYKIPYRSLQVQINRD